MGLFFKCVKAHAWTLEIFNMNKITNKKEFKSNIYLALSLLIVLNLALPVFSFDSVRPVIEAQGTTTQNDTSPIFSNPVTLLVGISSTELSYHEISNLSGFELFSVPYRSDTMLLVDQIMPSQVIIKHPSGFVGLYTIEGQLVRGIETTVSGQLVNSPESMPPSIIKPTEANPMYENVYYPGSVTGTIPHGGVGYTPPPKGRGVARSLLKLAAFTGIAPYAYPGYFDRYYAGGQLGFPRPQSTLGGLFAVSAIPSGIAAAATYVDARFDANDYNNARAQPRDYMFQPVVEGY